MLNLDTHILIFLLDGALTPREHQLVVPQPLAISDIVLSMRPLKNEPSSRSTWKERTLPSKVGLRMDASTFPLTSSLAPLLTTL
jgi:hypothetical protein